MKTIKDYLEKNGSFKTYLKDREVGFTLCEDYIIVEVDDRVAADIYELKTEMEIQDMLYDNYDIEVRFCEECGKPFDAGFTAGNGDWYCCEDCFEPVMNRDYGEGNWRPTDDEGYYGGFYEYLSDYNCEWEDTGIFYTEWY